MDVFRDQRRRVNTGEPSAHALAHVGKAGLALHRTGLNRGHGSLPKPHAAPGAGAIRNLSLEHKTSERPLSGIVGRLHQRILRERPQRGPHLDQVRAGVGRLAAVDLGSTQLQRQAHALLQPSHALGIQPFTPAPAKQQVPVGPQTFACQRRLNIDPPCRSNIDPGRVAGF